MIRLTLEGVAQLLQSLRRDGLRQQLTRAKHAFRRGIGRR